MIYKDSQRASLLPAKGSKSWAGPGMPHCWVSVKPDADTGGQLYHGSRVKAELLTALRHVVMSSRCHEVSVAIPHYEIKDIRC